MATSISKNATAGSFPIPPIIIQPLLDAIEGPVNTLLLNTIWCSFLIPIAIALLLSSPRSWRTPIFVMNVCAVALGLAFGVITIFLQKRSIALKPVGPSLLLAILCLFFYVPLCTQSILLVRVIAVYPPRELSWLRRLIIYGTFAAILTGRLINSILDFVDAARIIRDSTNFLEAELSLWTLPYVKVELILQLVYNVFASSLFLLRLHQGGALRTTEVGQGSLFTTQGQRSTYTSRLRGLFWIAVFNFVFPIILNIAIVILLFRDTNPQHTVDILVVNAYMDIICVLLATVWCHGPHWQNSTMLGSGSGGMAWVRVHEEATIHSLSTATFAPPSNLTSHTEHDVEMFELRK